MALVKFDNNVVRTIDDAELGVMFCAKDVAKVIEINSIRDALREIPSNHKRVDSIDTLGGAQNTTFVSEAGLYALIFQSRTEAAKRFRWFVCETVIPEYRRAHERRVLEQAERIIDEQQETIEALRELHNESGTLCMREVAVILKEYFYDTDALVGRNTLFEFLRQQGILDDNNIPYQQYVNKFASFRSDGKTTIRLRTNQLNWLKKLVFEKVEKKYVSRRQQHLNTTFKF